MALYEPIQRIDFVYISDHNAIYLKATVTVPLDVNEYIPTPPPVDLPKQPDPKPDMDITLRAMGTPSEQGRYDQTMPVLVKIMDKEISSPVTKLKVGNAIGLSY